MKFTFGRQQSDSSLISAVKKGDKGAYEQLFVRYYPTLLRFIHGMLKDNHMAEDIAQNIFMKLWIHREKLDSTQSLKNYLFVLAKHEIFNIFKAKRTTMLSLLPQLNDRDIEDRGYSIEEQYNYAELNELLIQNISKMPPQRQLIFPMSRCEHLQPRDRRTAGSLGAQRRQTHRTGSERSSQLHLLILPSFLRFFHFFAIPITQSGAFGCSYYSRTSGRGTHPANNKGKGS